MSLRPPQNLSGLAARFETGAGILDAEIVSEKAATLGRAGRKAQEALARLDDPQVVESEGREALLKLAADAVWKFFIQREACGLRDQGPVIRDMKIPRAVLVRLGAR
ncbi:MAG TPA: DUF6665 family protein [Phenylobacterium sp.]|nr:DUF6665 family protein [Phenylobacterium sp.]